MAGQASTRSVVSALEQDLAADWRHYHVQAHLTQFVALFVGSFVASVAAAGWHVAGWAALGSLVLAAAGGAVRQVFPQIPWSVVKSVVGDAKAAVEPAPAASSGAVTKAP
jgi:hypothetical protein